MAGPEPKTRTEKIKEDLGCAGIGGLFFGVPAALAFWDWWPLLIFPAAVVVLLSARVLGPSAARLTEPLRGRRRLKQAGLITLWTVGLAATAAVAVFGVTLFGDTDPGCVPSATVQCNLVIDGQVVGEADSSDAAGERFQRIMIALSLTLLGATPFCMLLWNGYRSLRHRN